MIVSKYPTNVPLSRRSVRRFLSQHGPKRDGCAAGQGRSSSIRVLSKIFRKAAAKAPVSLLIQGRSRHSESCKGVTASCHPKRTSCYFSRGCNFQSCHNNKHSSNHRAVNHITTNTVTSGLLNRLKVLLAACTGSVNPIAMTRTSCSFARVAGGDFCLPGGSTTRGTTRCISALVRGVSSYNNLVRYHISRLPTNLNRPIFSGLSTLLTRTVVSVKTMGNIRVNSNFRDTSSAKDAGGSPFYVRRNRIVGASGRSNKALNNVDSNSRLVLETTVGPAPSVSRVRRAMAGSNRRVRLSVRKHRSPVVMPHTIIIIRTVATLALTSLLLHGTIDQVGRVGRLCARSGGIWWASQCRECCRVL